MEWLKILVVLLALSLSVSACKKESEAEEEFQTGDVHETSKSFIFPAALKTKVDEEYVAFMKTQGPPFDIKTPEELLLQVPREYLDIDLTISPLGSGTLSAPTIFRLPRGGGSIDLKEYVKGAKGSFFVKMSAKKTTEPEGKISKLKVYFLSQGKKQKVDKEEFGSGCGKYMDITSYVEAKANDGIQVNATNQRYVSVLAGIYYFIGFEKEKIYLAAVKISDSRYSNLQCQ
ncbi:MAG: hypothetical protein AABZ31_04765 [Bdellovibrionota bacterium]